jgi:hypothetical protein
MEFELTVRILGRTHPTQPFPRGAVGSNSEIRCGVQQPGTHHEASPAVNNVAPGFFFVEGKNDHY